MAVRVRCPRCGRGLLARAGAVGQQSTCPACLAEITVPADIQADRPAPRESGLSCPRCRRNVEALWMTCPWCEEPLRGQDYDRYDPPDLDVRRDRKGTNGGLFALAGVGSVGAAVSFAYAWVMANTYFGGAGCLCGLVVGFLFVAMVVQSVVLLSKGGKSGGHVVGRVFVGALAVVGALVAVALFLCVLCTRR